MMSFISRALPAIAIFALVGCGGSGDGLDRQAIKGSVNLAGKPLAAGEIQFLPANDDGKTPPAGGRIAEGKYAISAESGPIPGAYKVVIHSDSGKGPALTGGMPGGAGTPNKELIPAKYNTNSTLTADIKSGQAEPFDFDLQAK